MEAPPVLVHRRALLSYNGLRPAERAAFEAAVAPLSDSPPEEWPQRGAIRLDSDEPLFVLRVDDSLRAIVRPAPGGQVELLDLVRRELLDRYFKGAG